MTSSRESLGSLIKTMADSRSSVLHNWDVLCSYDLKALNDVLREEYEKNPVNSHLKISVTDDIVGIPLYIDCDLKLGNPTLGFSTVQSGTYNFNIPIQKGSYCTQSLLNKSETTEIPEEYTIATSGPIRTITGTGSNQTINDANEIVEFGDRQQANVVLHFSNKLRNVDVLPKGKSKKLNQLFTYITNHFARNIKEVDYNIVQVVRQPENHEGLILTPKSFIITTLADENDVQNGALNIWIQTNESGQPKGNGQPSFYPNKNVLPVPADFTSSIFFSRRLINELYLKPALENYYDTMVTDLTINNTVFTEVIALMPKNVSKQFFNLKDDNEFYDKSFEYELDYKDSPYQIFTHDDKLKWEWKYETAVKKVETRTRKMNEVTVLELFLGTISPIGSIAMSVNEVTKILDDLTKYLKLTVLIDKSIDFEVENDTKFSAKVNLDKADLKVYVEKVRASGINLFGRSEEVDWDGVKRVLIPKLEQTIYMPEIDLGTLSYFAEANILFNEDRFRISPDRAVHFPYDTMVVGDITTPSARPKREQKTPLEEHRVLTNSGTTIKSPINTAIKWLTVGFDHLRSYSPVKFVEKLWHAPAQLNSDISGTTKSCSAHPTSVSNYDLNTTLILGDYVIRSLTKMKPLNIFEDSVNLLDAKAYAINIVEEFEEISKSVAIDVDFVPIALMSKIEREVINGNYKNVEKILLESMEKCDVDTNVKIAQMLEEQNLKFLRREMMITKNIFVGKVNMYYM